MTSDGWNTDGWQQMLDEREYRETYQAKLNEQFDEVFQSYVYDDSASDKRWQELAGGSNDNL